jgi:hypothetical protein
MLAFGLDPEAAIAGHVRCIGVEPGADLPGGPEPRRRNRLRQERYRTANPAKPCPPRALHGPAIARKPELAGCSASDDQSHQSGRRDWCAALSPNICSGDPAVAGDQGSIFPHRPLAFSRCNGSINMPRASWRGFLRLSLVSCPIYLSPATTRTKPVRLHQVWRPVPAPADEPEEDLSDRGRGQDIRDASGATMVVRDVTGVVADQSRAATRITLRPHDPGTGEEIEKREIVKGYEYSRASSSLSRPRSCRRLMSKARR